LLPLGVDPKERPEGNLFFVKNIVNFCMAPKFDFGKFHYEHRNSLIYNLGTLLKKKNVNIDF